MKVKIDKNKCTGCSVCAALCPEIFELSTDNKSEIKRQPEELENSRVKDAIISCPEEAIIEEKNLIQKQI